MTNFTICCEAKRRVVVKKSLLNESFVDLQFLGHDRESVPVSMSVSAAGVLIAALESVAGEVEKESARRYALQQAESDAAAERNFALGQIERDAARNAGGCRVMAYVGGAM